MKKLRRIFLKDGEKILFGKKTGSVETRYFDFKRFSLKNTFNLYIDFTIPPMPKNLNIGLIYYDKRFVEYIIQESFSFPTNKQIEKRDKKIQVIAQQDDKVLHKIIFESLPVNDSSVIIYLSDL